MISSADGIGYRPHCSWNPLPAIVVRQLWRRQDRSHDSQHAFARFVHGVQCSSFAFYSSSHFHLDCALSYAVMYCMGGLNSWHPNSDRSQKFYILTGSTSTRLPLWSPIAKYFRNESKTQKRRSRGGFSSCRKTQIITLRGKLSTML